MKCDIREIMAQSETSIVLENSESGNEFSYLTIPSSDSYIFIYQAKYSVYEILGFIDPQKQIHSIRFPIPDPDYYTSEDISFKAFKFFWQLINNQRNDGKTLADFPNFHFHGSALAEDPIKATEQQKKQ